MATSAQIENQDTGPFTDLEIERIREIAGLKTASEASGKVSGFSEVQRQATRADIAAWDAVGEGTVAVKGGRDGADYSQSRDRDDIRVRLRLRMGLDPYDPLLNPAAMRTFWVESNYMAEDTLGE